jgi:hypothetical protein
MVLDLDHDRFRTVKKRENLVLGDNSHSNTKYLRRKFKKLNWVTGHGSCL